MLQALFSFVRIFNLVGVALSSIAAIVMLLRKDHPRYYRS